MIGFKGDVPKEHDTDLPRQAINWTVVCTENSGSDVLMMQSTKDRMRYDASRSLNGA